jgi:polyhydroxyalkanoate synthesis regulator phasin
MTPLFKRLIYTSFGVASVTNEKIKELLEDLIQNSQFTEEEGKRIVDSFLFDLRQQVDSVNTNVRLKADELFRNFGVPTVQSIREEAEQYINSVKKDPSVLLKLHPKHRKTAG